MCYEDKVSASRYKQRYDRLLKENDQLREENALLSERYTAVSDRLATLNNPDHGHQFDLYTIRHGQLEYEGTTGLRSSAVEWVSEAGVLPRGFLRRKVGG